MVIHGIPWRLAKDYDSAQITESINLCDLFNLQSTLTEYYRRVHLELVTLETVIPGTPFIAVRVRQTYGHKGRVRWYDLNTQRPVSKADRVKWKHPLQKKATH